MKKISALVKVIGSSSYPGSVRAIIGYGYGHLNGGVEKDIPISNIPQDLRRPNSQFILYWDRETGEILKAEAVQQKSN